MLALKPDRLLLAAIVCQGSLKAAFIYFNKLHETEYHDLKIKIRKVSLDISSYLPYLNVYSSQRWKV